MPLEIRRLKIRELSGFAAGLSQDPAYSTLIPISRKRAACYAHNPHASPEDIGLLVAILNNRCVGYLGIMPGLFTCDSASSKVYWFCTFFVAAGLRGKGIGRQLINDAFSLGYDFAVSSMSPSSERAFRAAGMKDLGSLSYSRMDLRWCNPLSLSMRLLRALLRAIGIEATPLTMLAQTLDTLLLPAISSCFYLALSPWIRGASRQLAACGFSESQPHRFSAEQPAAEPDCSFLRADATIRWMLEYPWPVANKESSPDDLGYFFTPLCDAFGFRVFSSASSGYAVFSVTRAHGARMVKALDAAAPSDLTALLLIKLAAEQKAAQLEMPAAAAGLLRANPLLRLFLRTESRRYLYYPASPNSALAAHAARIRLAYCDGENPFA